MTKNNLTLSANQIKSVIFSLSDNKKVIKTIHPADNMLFLTLENNISIKITGHWKYSKNNVKIISSILDTETVEENFNKIEDLAEKLTLEQPIIKKITLNSDNKITIEMTNHSSLAVSVYKNNNEEELLSIDYSSQDDTAHFYYFYENGNWKQSILLKK